MPDSDRVQRPSVALRGRRRNAVPTLARFGKGASPQTGFIRRKGNVMTDTKFRFDWLVLPLLGLLAAILCWHIVSQTVAKELPSPAKTWAESRDYVLKPFAKRGEMDQGILRFTWYSLILVAKGYAIALVIGTPIGFLLGLSSVF